jgi:hypothetical protein
MGKPLVSPASSQKRLAQAQKVGRGFSNTHNLVQMDRLKLIAGSQSASRWDVKFER